MGQIIDKAIINTAKNLANSLDNVTDIALPQDISDIVKLHAKIAAGLAVIPIPGGDTIAAAGNIWTMYVRMNDKLGLKLSSSAIKTIASGVAGNLGAGVAGYLAGGMVAKFLPGLGSIAGAVIDAAVLYSLTLTSAYVYMKALIALAEHDGKDFSDIDIETHLSDAINNILSEDKDDINVVMKDARKSFKKEDMKDAVKLAKEAREEDKA